MSDQDWMNGDAQHLPDAWTRTTAIALVALTVAIVLVLGYTARAQEPRPDPGPTAEDIERFHTESSGISEHSVRRAGIEVSRRHAPFDLTWGLR